MSGAVPKLRFAGFEGAWKQHPLSDAWRTKGVRNSDDRYDKTQVLSVSGDCGIVNQIEHLGRSYAGVLVDNYHVVDHGDIVYTKSPLKENPYGIIKANRGKAGIVSTLYAVYEVKAKHDPLFWDAYFSLHSRTNGYLLPLVHKGAKNDMKINNERVLIDPVHSPSLPEQQKIAAFLGAVDLKIDALRRKEAALVRFKAGLMQKLFSQTLRFTRDDGSAFPDWEEKRLGDITKWASGGTPSKDNPDFWDGNIPWVSALAMHNPLVNDAPLKVTEGAIGKGTRLTPTGSVLLLVRGSMLYKRIPVCLTAREVAFNQDVKAVTAKKAISTSFLFHWLNAKEGLLLSMVTGTGIGAGKLETGELQALLVALPHPEEQQKIAAALSALDSKLHAIASQTQKIKAFKSSLLQQMFV